MERSLTRAGLVLFGVYVLLYGGFVLVNAFNPEAMEITLGGVNVAILYGFGLIIAAFVLAIIYGFLSSGKETIETGSEEDAGE